MNAPGAARKLLVVPVVGLAAAAVIAGATWGQQPASGAGEDKASTEFAVLGDGSLPTEKPAQLGAPRAPLSAEETGYAIHLASTDASIPATATNVRGEAGVEFLFADLPEDIESTGRKAIVHLYDYTADKGYQQTVDLVAGKVVKSQSSKTLQAATSPDEADVAMQIALEKYADAPFKAEFEASQGVPLVSADQVEYVAGTFVFDGTTTSGQECGVERCAQLMVQAADGAYLNTWDFVVNLSDQSIVKFK